MGFQHILAKHLKKPDGFVGKLTAILMNRINDSMNRITLQQLQMQPDEHILEIGFGNGKYFPKVLKQLPKGKLIGLDYSETMVNVARKRFKPYIERGQLDVVQGSVSEIPYEDAAFDKVFTVNTIYFWPDPTHDIQEIYRVLKNNGQLVITFRAKRAMEKLSFTKNGFTLYSAEEVMEIAKSAGFQNVSSVLAPISATDVYCVIAVK